jgi:predicted transglutaminase-like cysteine proteinase
MPVALSRSDWRKIRRIHRELQRAFIWTSDREQHGVIEHWGRPQRDADGALRGDCDDYAIEAWHRLDAAGIPRKALKLAVCRTNREAIGFDHAVLAIDADDCAYVLDCNQLFVVPAIQCGYDHWHWQDGAIDRPWVGVIV